MKRPKLSKNAVVAPEKEEEEEEEKWSLFDSRIHAPPKWTEIGYIR